MAAHGFSVEMERKAIDCYLEHVGQLRYGDPTVKAVLNEIVEPATESEYLTDGDDYPSKSTIATRAGEQLATVTSKSNFWQTEDTIDAENLWAGLQAVGLVTILSSPWADRVRRNDVLAGALRGTHFGITDIPDPEAAKTEQERRRIQDRRRMMACFGLNLLSKCQPAVLEDAPEGSYPEAYATGSPVDVFYGLEAEQSLSTHLDDIDTTLLFEEDELNGDRNDEYYQLRASWEFDIADASPVRNAQELELFAQNENTQLLKTVTSDAELAYCQCKSLDNHMIRVLSNLTIGGDAHELLQAPDDTDEPAAETDGDRSSDEGPDDETDEDDSADDEPAYCSVADNSHIDIRTSWGSGDVFVVTILRGLTRS